MNRSREVIDYNSDVELLSPRRLSERWNGRVSLGMLKKWRHQGKGPSYVKYVGRVMYPLDFVIEFERDSTFIQKG